MDSRKAQDGALKTKTQVYVRSSSRQRHIKNDVQEMHESLQTSMRLSTYDTNLSNHDSYIIQIAHVIQTERNGLRD